MAATPLFSPADIRVLKVICYSLCGGIVIFYVIAFSLSYEPGPASLDINTLNILRLMHLITIVAAFGLDRFLFERIISGKLLNSVRGQVLQTFGQRYRVAAVVRMALFEGSALFGAVVVMTAATAGAVHSDVTYYFHAISVVILIQMALTTVPTAGKIVQLERVYGAAE